MLLSDRPYISLNEAINNTIHTFKTQKLINRFAKINIITTIIPQAKICLMEVAMLVVKKQRDFHEEML